jgi:hypothetical protein
VTLREVGSPQWCAWCDCALPEARVVLSVVYGADVPVMETCSMPCLTHLVAALARKATQARQRAAGVQR